MAKLFFSYSHKDEDLRNELEIHLTMLKRQGFIETWHDRRIDVGDVVDNKISKELDQADIILLLVSPYFLASNYCYDIEMHRALERHSSGEAHVIPVILHPCDWHPAPFGKLLAAPADGKPISKYANLHEAFLNVVTSIRSLISKPKLNEPYPVQTAQNKKHNEYANNAELPRSSNLRIKKEFTQQQKDEFLEQSYEYIQNYFEGSLAELSKRNYHIMTKFKKIDANHFSSIVYKNGDIATQCKIWLGGSRSFGGGISYSSDISSSDNSMNDSLSVDVDGYMPYLKPISFMRDEEKLSQQGAAEYFWEKFIKTLQN
jgi:hypothetical protein